MKTLLLSAAAAALAGARPQSNAVDDFPSPVVGDELCIIPEWDEFNPDYTIFRNVSSLQDPNANSRKVPWTVRVGCPGTSDDAIDACSDGGDVFFVHTNGVVGTRWLFDQKDQVPITGEDINTLLSLAGPEDPINEGVDDRDDTGNNVIFRVKGTSNLDEFFAIMNKQAPFNEVYVLNLNAAEDALLDSQPEHPECPDVEESDSSESDEPIEEPINEQPADGLNQTPEQEEDEVEEVEEEEDELSRFLFGEEEEEEGEEQPQQTVPPTEPRRRRPSGDASAIIFPDDPEFNNF